MGLTDLKADSMKGIFLMLRTCSFISHGNRYIFRSAAFTNVNSIQAFTTHHSLHAPNNRVFYNGRVSNL